MNRTIYLAAGCFWGAQHYLKQIRGVVETQTGFANGETENPVYEEVYTDRTGYAEAVRVVYDPEVLPLRKLLQLYFLSIEPTSVNRQGDDCGTRYRTGIYYEDPALLPDILAVTEAKAQQLGQPLAVEVGPLLQFFPAEDYHQDYLIKHPTGYCHISPKLMRLARAKKEEGQ